VTDGPRRPLGAAWYPLASAALVGAAALAAITAVPVGVTWDDAVYLVGAKSIATGAGYRFLHLAGAPPAVHFPVVWPALLAVIWKLNPSFPDNGVLLKLVNPLLLAAAAALACRYGARRLDLPSPVAALAAVVFAAAWPLAALAGTLAPEPLFIVTLFLALATADAAADRGGWRRAVVAGVAAGAVALVMSAGLALVPALIVSLVVARRSREAVVAAVGAAALLVPWQFWLARHVTDVPTALRGLYGPPLDRVLDLYRERGAAFVAIVARTNLLAVMHSLGGSLFPLGPRDLRPLLVTLVLLVTAMAVIKARRRATTALLFLPCHLAIVLAAPSAPERLLWAVWPLLGLLLARGAVECWRIGAHHAAVPTVRATGAFACAVGVFAIGGHAGWSIRGAARSSWDSAARGGADSLLPVATWIAANTSPDDVVAVDGEPFIYLRTGRTVVPVRVSSPDDFVAGTPLVRAAADLRALIAVGRPRYAVFSGAAGEREAAKLLDGRNGTPTLQWVATLPGGGVAYEVVRHP
jgi:hypothetical protein